MTEPLGPIPDNHDEEGDDRDEDEATEQESESPGDFGPKKRRLFTATADPPISALCERCDAGDLVLNPSFQRRQVWDDKQSSKLIESVILEVPLPVPGASASSAECAGRPRRSRCRPRARRR